MAKSMTPLFDKIMISGLLTLRTGMHIGSSSDFAPIGAVDSIIIRDAVSNRPIIPGSSLKGKLRWLLARVEAATQLIGKIEDEPDRLKRLFGSHQKPIRLSRLQFADSFMTEASAAEILRKGTDLYLSEIKFENTINRISSVANPRQIERVPAGSQFAFQLVYNVEDPGELKEDIDTLCRGLRLLQLDYLGGHGTRGYGRIALSGLTVASLGLSDAAMNLTAVQTSLKGVEYSEILPE